jgi:hypothetical protein
MANEITRFGSLIFFFLVILSEKIVTFIIKFSKFVKISKKKVERNHHFQFLT